MQLEYNTTEKQETTSLSKDTNIFEAQSALYGISC